MTIGSIRDNDFKIGCFHGKLLPEDRSSEAQLRNELFLIGMLKIEITNHESKDIRILAYEMPLERGKKRGKCIDLFGYDEKKVPYIIELKKEKSNENISDIIRQINDYENLFQKVKSDIELEIKNKYHWSDFHFSEGIGKVILAHRKLFDNRQLPNYTSSGIYFCSFSRLQDVYDANGNIFLVERFGTKGYIRLKIENK